MFDALLAFSKFIQIAYYDESFGSKNGRIFLQSNSRSGSLCSDLDSYDLIVAMDIEVRDEILRIAGSQPLNGNDYANKVIL